VRATLERKATAGEMATATLIVQAVRDATVAGAPLYGQVAVADAAGIGGSTRSKRRQVSNVIWLCYKIAPILYPDMVFNRTNDWVYTVGTPTVYEQLQNAMTCIFTADTKLGIVVDGLRATHDADAATVAAVAKSMRGVAQINEADLFAIMAAHTPS